MPTYYTEEPYGDFRAEDDEQALLLTEAAFVYRESDTEDGKPFVILREEQVG